MKKGRLEAFSDGVLAIILTIMVLELKVPEGNDWKDLMALLPKFISYILSFTMILIYWNNHHHMFQTVEKVNGKILIANGIMLFFLSLIPFATAWMGEHNFESKPVIFQGIIFFFSGISSLFLTKQIIAAHGKDSILAKALEKNHKFTISWMGYLIAIGLGFFFPKMAALIYFFVAMMWLVPDKEIERLLD